MLNDKIALITGASRGIGKAIAISLGDAGATVIGTATSDSGAQNITQILKDNNIKGEGIKLDVNNDDIITQTMKTINDNYGAIDILVNNAGITRDNLFMRMDNTQWDEIINTNLSSVFKMSKVVIRAMMKKKFGRIISITSVVGAMGNAGQTNYAAAKAGIMGFTKSLAREVASRGITVNAVAPGFIETDMTNSLTAQQKESILSQVPIARLGSAKEIADTVLFLASDSSSYITAQTIHVNGGMYTV